MVVLATGRGLDPGCKGYFECLVTERGGLSIPLGMVLGGMALEHMVYPTRQDNVAEVFVLGGCLVVLLAHTCSHNKKTSHSYIRAMRNLSGTRLSFVS